MSILSDSDPLHKLSDITQCTPNHANKLNPNHDEQLLQLSNIKKHNDQYNKGQITILQGKRQSIESLTEQQIYSHQVIRQIMRKSDAKTVKHNINEIDPKTQLYSKPIKLQQENFSEGCYISACSTEINRIYERLSSHHKVGQKIIQLVNSKKKPYIFTSRPSSGNPSSLNQRISVSGLVSHNFNSVNARRSLGFNHKETNDQNLNKQLLHIKKRNSCPINRHHHIINRKPTKQAILSVQMQEAAVSDFTLTTDSFLHSLRSYGGQNAQIYGEKMEKLKCVKQYMQKEQVSYEQAMYIVNQIDKKNKITKASPIYKKKKIREQSIELNKTKIAHQSKRVMLKQLYFIQS